MDTPLPVSTVAERWGVSTDLVYKLYHSGKLRGFKAGGRVLIYPASLEALEREYGNAKAIPATLPEPKKTAAKRPGREVRGLTFLPRPV